MMFAIWVLRLQLLKKGVVDQAGPNNLQMGYKQRISTNPGSETFCRLVRRLLEIEQPWPCVGEL